MKQRHILKRAAAILMTASMLTVSCAFPVGTMTAAAAPTTVANPIIWADVPDDDIIRVGDTYYMISTTMYFSPGAPIMKSKDLVSWEICNYVYDIYADGEKQNLVGNEHDYAHGQWAASLRYKNGTFYVFFGSYGTGNSYIYKTDDIEHGTWTRSEINGMYHDASMLLDDDGRNYLVYGGGGEIKIKELNSDMTGFQPNGAEKTLFKTGLDNLAGEGSHIQKIGDYYYVFVIAWPSTSGRIELCYRSKELLGDYEGKTILNSGLGTYGSGVAQGGIIDTPSGEWYGLLFQDHGSVGRIPVLVPVTWEDGFPMMGINGKAPTTLTIDTDYTGTALAKDDDFSYSSDQLMLEWQWNHNPDHNAWSVTERDGWLRLHNAHIAKSIMNARNTLTMRTEGPACSSAIRLDASNMKDGDYAGLSAFQFNYGNVGVRVGDDGRKYIYMAKNAVYGGNNAQITDSYDNIIEEVPLSGDIAYLKADFQFNTVDNDFNVSNNIDKVDFYYSLDGSEWTKIGDTINMTYDLKLFTGYRSAIYSYPTKTTGGYADIDFFDYERENWNNSKNLESGQKNVQNIEPDANGYYFHDTFENSENSWSGRGSAKIVSDGEACYEGNHALYCSGRESAWNGAAKKLSNAFVPGESYSFSANVMYPEGSETDTFHLTLQYDGADGEAHYDKVATGAAAKGEWVQLANTEFTIPAGAKNLVLYVETDNSTNSFYVDDVIGAVAGTEIQGAGKSTVRTVLQGDVNGDGIINVYDWILAKKGLLYGFNNAYDEKSADIDGNGKAEVTDLVSIHKYLKREIQHFPKASAQEEEKTSGSFVYDSAVQYHTAPGEYLEPCVQAGTITKETYTGIRGTKSLNVYTPYNYDPSKKYNIFYLMHGGGENENTIFSNDVRLGNMLDHMIMNGELEPMIVVTPTFNGSGSEAGNFWEEFRKDVVPFVEGKYSTYAKSANEADLQASRMHRAYGGFSMGSLSTWCVADHDMDLVGYFMPLSGNNWEGMNTLTKEIDSLGLKQNQYFFFCATGSEDLAYPNMRPEMEDLKGRTNYFNYTSDFSKGNFYFMVAENQTHWWGAVRHYVYDALPYFFHES
ncbi:MAG: family 43 glycosylhydrolase [Oscillospiraceae bacterium]|nr:family 43 glycosylhydrolase [Oscillospiraceae bacterium]